MSGRLSYFIHALCLQIDEVKIHFVVIEICSILAWSLVHPAIEFDEYLMVSHSLDAAE